MVEGRALVQVGARSQDAHICSNCVAACDEIFEKYQEKPEPTLEDLPSPKDLVDHLDTYIIGQERVKRHAGRGGREPLQAHPRP